MPVLSSCLQPTRIEEEIVSKEELDQDVGLNLLTLLGGKNLGGYVTGAALNRTPPAGGDDGTAGSLPGLQPPGTPVSTAASSLQPSSSSLLSSTQGRHSLCTSLSALSLEGDALEPAVYIASDTPPRFSSGSRLQGGAGSSEEDREAIAASIIPAMEAVLATVEEWRFDAFKLAEVTQGHPLSALSFWLFKRYNLIEQFQLDAVKLARFLRKVEDGYPNNP